MHIDIDLSDCNHGDEADELIASTKLELAKSVKIFNYNYYYISPIKIPIDFPNGLEKISIEFNCDCHIKHTIEFANYNKINWNSLNLPSSLEIFELFEFNNVFKQSPHKPTHKPNCDYIHHISTNIRLPFGCKLIINNKEYN